MILVALGSLTLVACTGQDPPPRAPLPDVATAVAPAVPCAFLVGEGQGIEVSEVRSGAPADGRLLPGDVVIEVDGAAITTGADLLAVMAEKSVGDRIVLEVVREGDQSTVDLTLTAHPDNGAQPLIGIGFNTKFDRVPPDAVPTLTLADGHDWLVAVNGSIFSVRPEDGSVGATGLEAPDGPWVAAGGRVFRIADPGTETAKIVDETGAALVLGSGAQPVALLGAVDQDLVVALQIDAELVATRLDLTAEQAVWVEPLNDPAAGIPVVAFASPDGSRLLVGMSVEGQEQLSYRVWDAADGIADPTSNLSETDVLVAFGWFDDDHIAAQVPGEAIVSIDVATGSPAVLNLPGSLEIGSRLMALGDASHLLIYTDDSLITVGADELEARDLIKNCRVEAVSRNTASR